MNAASADKPRAHDDPPGAHTPNLLVMISGGGRTLVNLQQWIQSGRLRARIAHVVASRPCAGVERARAMGLTAAVEAGDLPAARLRELSEQHDAVLVVLAGYLRRVHVPPGFERRIVNIHPALLPAFGGRGMYGDRVHRAVIDAGCRVSGCTVHLVDEEYDHGAILAQSPCEVRDDDDAHTLAARVFELECALYPQVIDRLLRGRVEVNGRRATIVPG